MKISFREVSSKISCLTIMEGQMKGQDSRNSLYLIKIQSKKVFTETC